jgi:LPS-assembly protein
MAWRSTGVALALLGAASLPASAQIKSFTGGGDTQVSRNEPVFYQADSAEYDRDTGFVTLTGHVEIWQGQRVLRADKVTYDRNTGVAAGRGHVVLLEPNGEVLFADYAELSQGMKDGILTNLRAQLAQNGRLAANGARRLEAHINELSRVIYSTCNACKDDPNGPLEWDIRARSAVQDLENKRIEYRDAVVDLYGWPVVYFPYFTQPDPSAKRASGFLPPSFGESKYIGVFGLIPYFWAIDKSTDATITPWMGTKSQAIEGLFRRAFNNGTVTVNTSVANDQDRGAWDLFGKGQFAIDDEWRWGFDVQRASSQTYFRDFRLPASPGAVNVLASNGYLEGFAQGSYSRLDVQAYQGLVTSIDDAKLPFVLPRYTYDFVGAPDALGGRFALSTTDFDVLRSSGTDTRRASLSMNWERPATGWFGDLWKLVFHVDSALYNTYDLSQQPSFGAANSATAAQGMPTVALEGHWPLMRAAGRGTQVIEPIVQLIAAPQGSSYAPFTAANGSTLLRTLIPNEDSLDFEFTDASLFSLNRYPGIDRLEGGPRANVALHGAWWFADGQQLDALVGQGYRAKPDHAFPTGSGLEDTVTDVVGHLDYTPSQNLDIGTHERFSHRNMSLQFADAIASYGPSWLKFNTGYIYEAYNPYTYYDQTPTGTVFNIPGAGFPNNLETRINEITFGFNATHGRWRMGTSLQSNLQTVQMVSAAASVAYEDECVVVAASFFRRFTSVDGDNGATTALFQITLKTVGTFGFNGL